MINKIKFYYFNFVILINKYNILNKNIKNILKIKFIKSKNNILIL